MRILAIMAIVAATGFTVGCSKQPTEAETANAKQDESSVAVEEPERNATSETPDILVVQSGNNTNAVTDTVTALTESPAASPVESQKRSEKSSVEPAQTKATVNQAAPVSASTSLITKLLDEQAAKAKIAQAQKERDAKQAQLEQQQAKANAEKLLAQNEVVAAKPDVNLEGYSFFGDPTQPGYQVQVEIFTLVAQGTPLDEATNKVIQQIADNEDGMIGGEANRIVSLDLPVSTQFIGEISRVTNLTDATKLAIETVPDKVTDIVTLGVVLYPDYAQDIINAAALTGEISDEDALLLAIAAGADPTSVSTATASGTAAGGSIAAIPIPLGSGVGAGGAGGGDTTASTN